MDENEGEDFMWIDFRIMEYVWSFVSLSVLGIVALFVF